MRYIAIRMPQIKISKYSSLNFDHDWKRSFERDEPYIQKFSPFDNIIVQYSVPSNRNMTVILADGSGQQSVINQIPKGSYTDDADKVHYVYEFYISNRNVGNYHLEIRQQSETAAYTDFCILPDECLRNTVLLSYVNRMNDFDVIFTENENYFTEFDFRVEGGFLPSETSFLVESNEFRDQRHSLTQLSALPYRKETLTVGDNKGVPIWAGEKINLIFSVTTVKINGTEYVRSEGSTPQINMIAERYPKYIFKIELEKYDNYNSGFDLPNFKVLGTIAVNILGTISNKAIQV